MANGADTVETVGKVLAALAITTAENNYVFTKNMARRTVQAICPTCDWYYGYATGGPYFPVPANVPFNIKLNYGDSQTIYLKTQSGSGTLSLVVAK
jgi:hypothetical protein